MTPALQRLPRSSLKSSVYVPSLPLELWILIFFQNTDPSHLYTVCRQVCSSWRTEIPRVIAKKYLEDPAMVQIHSNCENSWCMQFTCLLEYELGFSHYEGHDRAVFKPIFHADHAEQAFHEDECTAQYIRARDRESQSVDDFRFHDAPDFPRHIVEKVNGKRVDLPLYQIRIKWVSNDTELPGLQVDFAKGEISFEWQRMLELFFREAAVLDRHDSRLATEAMEWLDEEERSIAAVLVRTWKDQAARESHRMEVRRERIKDWYRTVHDHKHSGRWDKHHEEMPLGAFRGLEWPEKCIRPCAEDTGEKETMRLRHEAYDALRLMDWIVHDRKVPAWNGPEIASYWETLANNILFAETRGNEYRIMNDILRPERIRRLLSRENDPRPVVYDDWDQEDNLHPSARFAYWAMVQNSLEDTDDHQSEDLSTKAKPHERREKEKGYAAIWLGRSRL